MAEHEITLATIYDLLQSHTACFSEHEITLATIHELLQSHTARFSEHEITLTSIHETLQDHSRRLERLDHFEAVQNQMAIRLINVESTLKEHSTILRSMQLRVDSLHGLVEELERRTGRIEQEYVMITEALRRLEKRFDRIEAEHLIERIAALEARVQALETAQP